MFFWVRTILCSIIQLYWVYQMDLKNFTTLMISSWQKFGLIQRTAPCIRRTISEIDTSMTKLVQGGQSTTLAMFSERQSIKLWSSALRWKSLPYIPDILKETLIQTDCCWVTSYLIHMSRIGELYIGTLNVCMRSYDLWQFTVKCKR